MPRTTTRRSALVAFVLYLTACASPRGGEAPPADVVLTGGKIYTMDDARSWAEALAIRDGGIVFVGSDAEAREHVGPSTEVVALEGRMVLPGFHDSHVHVATGGIELGQCDLNGLETREAVNAAIEACAAASPDVEWIVGGGWDLPLFPDGNPSSEELDRIVPDRRVYLSSADAHSAWVSSGALEIAGVTTSTSDPPNGRIERDPSGAPSGTLRESAMALVSRHIPPLTPEDHIEGLKRGLALANRVGITSFVEANANDGVAEAYAALSRSGELTARVRLSLAVDELRDEAQVEALVEKRARFSGSGLRADGAKIYADGVIEAGTAALLEPYVGLGHRGELIFEPEALDRLVARLDAEGFQVHVHAIGDRAIRASLDAFEHARESNGPRDARHQISHIELFHPDDIPRFRSLSVVADFQPLWAYADSYITDLTEPVLGPERSRWLYPIRSVAESGAHLAAGSDWSVSSINPLDGIEVAVTRKALGEKEGPAWIPEEKVDLDTILAAYTRGGAYVQHQEDLVGTIEAGKRADLVVLERNLFDVPPDEIHTVKAVLTFLDGEVVFRDEDTYSFAESSR